MGLPIIAYIPRAQDGMRLCFSEIEQKRTLRISVDAGENAGKFQIGKFVLTVKYQPETARAGVG